MGKKGTKRKTQWRTLAITECPQQNSKNALIKKFANNALNNSNSVNLTTSTAETNNVEEAISQDDEYSNSKSYTNPSYLKRKFSTSSDYRNDYRNNNNSSYSYNNSKHNSTSSASSLYSSSRYSSSYRRRPFSSSQQHGSGRFASGHGAERTISRGYRTSASSRSGYNFSTKPLFNEDDYTRISTPRQDVIFKKGYFSQPKKYVSSTDTNTTTSSTAASIVSAEESASTLSGPSLTPEQCSSLGDSIDPEQGFVYSFIDQNGVVYSYVPNGFDQYNGQMMMLPYGYPPYMCSPDVNSPTGSNEEESEQIRTPVESHETPSSDLNETKVIDEVPKDASCSVTTVTEENASSAPVETSDNKCDDVEKKEDETAPETVAKDEEIAVSTETETSETPKENEIIPDSVQNIPEQFYNYEYTPYYAPQILYPYMYPQPFVPLYGNEFDVPIEEEYNEDIEDQNRIRLRCRKKRRATVEGNSTGVSNATTEDECELEESVTVKEDIEMCSPEQNVASPLNEESSSQIKETENVSTTLNVNVKEFIPRGITKSILNADVQEFHPRHTKNVTSKHQIVSSAKTTNDRKPVHQPPQTTKGISNEDAKKTAELTPQKTNDRKPRELTLAEKIKQSLAQEAKVHQLPTSANSPPIFNSRRNTRKTPPPRKADFTPNSRNTRSRTTKKPENAVQIKVLPPPPTEAAPKSSQPSYAQIANKSAVKTVPSLANQPIAVEKENVIADSKSKTEPETEKVSNAKPELLQTNNVPTPSEPVQNDIWQTVKHRGKRGKHAKDHAQEDVSFDQSFDEIQIVEEPTIEVKAAAEKLKAEDVVVSVLEESKEETSISDIPEAVNDTEGVTRITLTPVSTKKKTPKSKHRKSAKKSSESSAKKRVQLDMIEPVFELPNKTETTNSDTIRKLVLPDPSTIDSLMSANEVVENGESNVDEEDEPMSFSSTPPEFSFDRIFMNKSFARSPMDILKGFDYTYKNKSILKEEEEMVLSVIKSISSNSTTPSPPKISPAVSVADDESGDEKTIVENSCEVNRQENGSETDNVSELSLDGEMVEENNAAAMVEVAKDVDANEELGLSTDEEVEMVVEKCDAAFDEAEGEKYDATVEHQDAIVSPAASNKDENLPVKSEDEEIDASDEHHETLVSLTTPNKDDNIVLVPSVEELAESPNYQENDNIKQEKVLHEEVLLNETAPVKVESSLLDAVSDSELVTDISLGEETTSDTILNDVEKENENLFEKSNSTAEDYAEVHRVREEEESPEERLVNGCDVDKFEGEETTIIDENEVVAASEPRQEELLPATPADYSSTNGYGEKPIDEERISSKLSPSESVTNGCNTDETNEHDITENIRKYILQCSRNSMSPRRDVSSNSGYESPVSVNEIRQNGFHTTGGESEPTTPVECTPRLSIPNSDIIITTFEDYETSSQNSFDYDCSDYPNERFERELSRSLASSPFEKKERILDELDDIVVPMLDAKDARGSSDYVTCVNVLANIIQSRECSLEPERCSSIDINRKYSQQPKESRECSLEPYMKRQRQCSLEPRSCSAVDYTACVDGLANLVKSRECSVEPEVLKSEVSKLNQSALNSNSDKYEKQNEELENESSQKVKVNGELVLNGFSRTDDVEATAIPEDSSKILNASISCDRSSGIGSDSEDNQPSSPENTDTGKTTTTTLKYLNRTAQSNDAMPCKQQYFPINTAVSSDTCTSHRVTNTPKQNVLPNLCETNSVHCDNQSVSYTSSKRRSLGSGAELAPTSDECTDKSDLVLRTTPKFPTSTECQSNHHFPITEAVKQWLVQKSKEPTPEPMFRLPDDPGLKDFLARRIEPVDRRDSDADGWSSTDNDEANETSEDEYAAVAGEAEADYLMKQRTNPKNLLGNPLHVSSCKLVSIDSDSDYNSDSNDHHHHHNGHVSDDNTCERVAETQSDSSENLPEKSDLLEFWDDEFIRNPKRWLSPAVSTRMSSEDSKRRGSSRSSSADVEPYDSLYGKTIDYNQLVASNYEFLSNNILSFSKDEHQIHKSDEERSPENILRAVKEKYCAESMQSLSSNNKFSNDTYLNRSSAVNSENSASTPETSNTDQTSRSNIKPTNNEKCMKPPEVCCILM